jgi:tetratricopeptide (TPR) repeat protein
VLQVFAALHRGVNQTTMIAILRMLYEKYQIGPFYFIMEKNFRERAISDGLLVKVGSIYYCHNDLMILLIIESIKQNRYQLIVECAQVSVPYLNRESDTYGISINQQNMEKKRRVLIAFFSQDDKQLLQLTKLYTYQINIEDSSDFLKNSFIPLIQPYYSTLFDYISPQARYFLLAYCLQNYSREQFDYEQALKLLKKLLIDIELINNKASAKMFILAPQLLLQEQSLLSANFSTIKTAMNKIAKVISHEKSSDLLLINAKIKAIQGQYQQSIEVYQQALSLIKKETKKQKISLPGWNGIFYILALLSTKNKTHRVLAKQQIALALHHNNDENEFALLNELIYKIENPNSAHVYLLERENLLGFGFSSIMGSCYLLLWSLCNIWMAKKLSSNILSKLKKASMQAKSNKLHWLYIEIQCILFHENKKLVDKTLLALLENKTKNSAELKKIICWTPLVDLIHPMPAWEVALNSLQEISQVNKTSQSGLNAEIEERSSRLTWRLSIYGGSCELEPREQVFGKNKKWSQGRRVSLERLHDETSSFDYLTEQDKSMCRRIETETHFESYGRYPKTYYYASGFSFLKEAIGHPLLFRTDNPNQTIELTHSEVVLQVQSSKTMINLQIFPYPDRDENFVVIEESKTKALLVALNSQHRLVADIIGNKGLNIPGIAKQQVIETISRIAPLLTIHSDIGAGEQGAGKQGDAKQIKANAKIQIHIQPSSGDGLEFECFVQPFNQLKAKKTLSRSGAISGAIASPLFHPGQGHAIILSEINGEAVQTSRNLKAEKKNAQLILDKCPLLNEDSSWHWDLFDIEDALDTLLQLQSITDVVELKWPQGVAIKLKTQTHLKQMQINIRNKKDWFEVDGQLKLEDGQVIAMQELLMLMGPTPGRFIKLENGEFLALTEEFKSRLSGLQFMGKQGQVHSLAAPLIDELTDGMQIKSGKHWQLALDKIEQAKNFEPKIPSTLQAQLRDYQIDGFKWLARLAHWGAGACLADDMGLGKTLQGLALILTRAAQGPTLILAPTSVSSNWINEIKCFAPTLNAQLFGYGDREKMLKDAGPFDVIICSYGLLQSESEKLNKINWHSIIADEAQAFKNSLTKRSQAMMALQGDFKIIMSGTPIENHLGELWNLYRFINPGLLGSKDNFNKQFATPIEADKDKEAGKRLKNLIKPFILRRLKTDVLTELPAKTEITIEVELSKEESALYEALRQKAIENLAQAADHPGQKRIKMLAEIMRLRRLCCNTKLVMPEIDLPSSKLMAFANIVEELKENRHKALVFSQFVGHLSIIREYLDRLKIPYQYLDGSTPQKKRQLAVNAFQAGEGDLFLISLKAGGSGLNLTAADYVIHMDPWWNPAVEDQASDRAHRIGQTRPVTIYRLVTKGTIESKIVQLHQQKRELANNLLEGSEMSGKMSVDEMFNLIKESY